MNIVKLLALKCQALVNHLLGCYKNTVVDYRASDGVPSANPSPHSEGVVAVYYDSIAPGGLVYCTLLMDQATPGVTTWANIRSGGAGVVKATPALAQNSKPSESESFAHCG